MEPQRATEPERPAYRPEIEFESVRLDYSEEADLDAEPEGTREVEQ